MFKKIATYSPALGRLAEISAYAVLAYGIGKISQGDFSFDYREVLAVALVPVLAFVGKVKRDFEKEIEDELEKYNQ